MRLLFAGGGYCELGDNVAASHISLTCWNQIIIGKDVLIGSNTIITDTDFHSLDSEYRANERNKNYDERKEHIHTAPVHIGEGAFIGARCIILKGVSIGSKSIVGAGSVVTRSIPEYEVWAGNPAKFIRKIEK